MRNSLILFVVLLSVVTYAAVSASLSVNPVSLPIGQSALVQVSTVPNAEVVAMLCVPNPVPCSSNSGYAAFLISGQAWGNITTDATGNGMTAVAGIVPGTYTISARVYSQQGTALSNPVTITFYDPQAPQKCATGWLCSDSVHKAYQNADCSKTQYTYCQFGCIGGNCTAAPVTPSTTPTKTNYKTAAAMGNGPIAGGVILTIGVAVITYGFLRREY